METTEVHRGMNEERKWVYVYNGILSNLKKERNRAVWMSVDYIMLNECQSQNDKYCMIPLIWDV